MPEVRNYAEILSKLLSLQSSVESGEAEINRITLANKASTAEMQPLKSEMAERGDGSFVVTLDEKQYCVVISGSRLVRVSLVESL